MAVNIYREYRLKFYLNMRHYIIIHDVKSDDIMVTRVHDGVITSRIASCKEE